MAYVIVADQTADPLAHSDIARAVKSDGAAPKGLEPLKDRVA